MDPDKFFKENEDWRPHADLVIVPPLPEELMKEFPGDVSVEVLSRCGEWVWDCGGHVTRGAIYARIRREEPSCGDKWATMLCLNAPPGLQTSDTFWAGRKPWHELCTPEYAASIKSKLAAKGCRIGANDEYMAELARFPGDPEAVIPFSGARSHIKSLCESRGWGCEGAVTVKHREPEKDLLSDEECVPMAEDLIRQKAAKMVKENPDLKRIPRATLRAKVLEKYGPSKK